ncbi:MAG: metallophosphoesterase [Lachnospiraceae bacterium]|nr:metallophosphoesterase [Lachnospiraceae bacterium]
MKFIHISDVHLGIKPDRGRFWSDERAEEIEEAFKNVVHVCDELQVDLLLIAGDLYDFPPTEKELRKLDVILRSMYKTKTVIIAGASDYIEEGSAWENFNFVSDTVLFPRDKAVNAYFEDLNVCITGFSYGKPEYKDRLLEKLKPGREDAYNILLGYGGSPEHMPFSKEKLAMTGFDYFALGSVHKVKHVLKNKMAFPGSLEPLDYTETGKHGYIFGEVDDEKRTGITWVPSNIRSYINMTVTVESSMDFSDINALIEKQILKSGEKNIYRILINGKVNSNVSIDFSSLKKKYYVNQIIDKTESYFDIDELERDNDNNLLGKFIKELSDDDSTEDKVIREKAIYYGIDALTMAGE